MSLMFRVVFLVTCFTHVTLASSQFLTISDIHYGSHNTSRDGKDTGSKLLAITFAKFKQLSKDVDFILTLGDLPTHSFGYSPEKSGYEETVFHGFFVADTQHKPMFYVSGNNDSLSGNYQPFESEGKSPLNYAHDWSGACIHCKGLIIDDTHMRKSGYYSTYVIPNNHELILIVLNATQWTKTSIFMPKYPNQEQDALTQLHWLKNQLKKHHAKQLLIAMHEPPGNDHRGNPFWHRNYLQQFINILEHNQHAYGEISLLTAHTHMDELRTIHLHEGKNIYAYSTPAVSRIHHNNSAMKRFNLDAQMHIKNFTTYYTTSTVKWFSLSKVKPTPQPLALALVVLWLLSIMSPPPSSISTMAGSPTLEPGFTVTISRLESSIKGAMGAP